MFLYGNVWLYCTDIMQKSQYGALMTESVYKEKYLIAFGKSLKKIRTDIAKKSLRLFSYEADIPCATLSRLENGTRIPNVITLKKIAVELNCSLPELLQKIEDNIPENIKNFEF